MKAQLYIGDDMVAETVEVVSPPREGDLIIFEGKRLRIREVGHNVDRKKLQIMCHVPPPSLLELVTGSNTAEVQGVIEDGVNGEDSQDDTDMEVE